MCSITLIAPEATMATTLLMPRVCCEACWPQQNEQEKIKRPLRMSWVVVTDENGNRRLQIDWHADRGD